MTETPTAGTVRYESGGRTWDIPEDLLELQRSWDAARGMVDTLVDGDDTEALATARAHRIDITMRLAHHPWLLEHQRAGRRYQADLALKACARQ